MMKVINLLFLLLAFVPHAFAAVTITPPSPQSNDAVVIRLENRFGAEASVASASIVRSGNAFTIVQNVNFACTIPSNPPVISEFNVGSLAPGAYSVAATINFLPSPATCARAPLVQTTEFAVAAAPGAAAVPALDHVGLLVLVAAMAMLAIVALRR